MIPGERERQEQRTDGNDITERLMAYLRDQWTPDSIAKIGRDKVIRLLVQAAYNFDSSRNIQRRGTGEYMRISSSVLDRYLDNWQGKLQGEDNRSKWIDH